MSDSVRTYELQAIRFLCPWDSLVKNTGVGCHALLQEIFLIQRLNPHLLYLPALAGGFFTLAPPGKPFLDGIMLKYMIQSSLWKPSSYTFCTMVPVSSSLGMGGLILLFEQLWGPWRPQQWGHWKPKAASLRLAREEQVAMGEKDWDEGSCPSAEFTTVISRMSPRLAWTSPTKPITLQKTNGLEVQEQLKEVCTYHLKVLGYRIGNFKKTFT